MLSELLAGLELKRCLSLGFAARCRASERLDALAMGEPDLDLQLRAAEALLQLEAADERFFERVRARLRSGLFTRAGMVHSLWRHAERDGVANGYAALDVLLAGLFDAGELPDELPSTPEMVAYQPAPGSVILSLLAQVRAGDVLYDLGSGLGRVVISVALLTGARAKGVEFQPGFCAYAARAAEEVGARGVEFVALDAREACLDDGTLFFLYTPFRGALLRSVLAQLRDVAAHRPIRVCTFGPCTVEVADEKWLVLRSGPGGPDALAVFESVSVD